MSLHDPALYVEDMRDACRKVQEYTRGFTQEQFLNNSLVADAVVRNLEIIGEAARHVPEELRLRYDQVPWQSIVGFRNVAIHNYGNVSLLRVWAIVVDDIPALLSQLQQMLDGMTQESA